MAAKIGELTKRVIDAKTKAGTERAVLSNLETTLDSKKSAANSIFREIAAGKIEGVEKINAANANAAAFEAEAEGITARIAAQRKVTLDAEKLADEAEAELATAQAENTKEDEKNEKENPLPKGKAEVGAPNAEKDPARGFKSPKDFLGSVMNLAMHNRPDERLRSLYSPGAMSGNGRPQAAAGADEQMSSQNPYGGFLIPHGIAPGILSIRPEDDFITPLCTNAPMDAPTVSYNARVDKDHTTSVSGGFVVTRRPETVAGTTSRTAFEQVTLTANEEWGFAFATERILTDSPSSFVAIIQTGFSDEYVNNSMRERITGLGVGERQGILTAASLCGVQVAKETNQKPVSIVKENIDKMMARCWKYNRAVWIANHNTLPALMSLVQVIGTGGNGVPYLRWREDGTGGTLLGRPIYFTEYAKTLGTVGDLMLVVFSECLNGTYESEQYAESMHVRFEIGERAFRFFRRNDAQWWWRSALTPANGDTLSPIVTLATRA